MADAVALVVVFVVVIVVFLIIFLSCMQRIQPYQAGIVVLFGSFKRVLLPGLNFVHPLSKVVRVDLRSETMRVPVSDGRSQDGTAFPLTAVVAFRVSDPTRALFQVVNYRQGLSELLRHELRGHLGSMSTEEFRRNPNRLSVVSLADVQSTSHKWGLKIESLDVETASP
jgi:regulator of protease activity HflC (stomatin/prohibitin superfamily)